MRSLRAFASANRRLGSLLRWPIDRWPMATTPASTCDVVIVLGAALTREGAMSALLEERVRLGVKAFFEARARFVLMTGAGEAPTMAEAAAALGIDQSAILIENRARSTRENALFSRELLQLHRLCAPLVVTQPFHRPRAVGCFRKLGVLASALDFVSQLETATAVVREYVALPSYWARGWMAR